MFRLQDYTHGDVAGMSVEALRAEVRFWRDSGAIRLLATIELVEEAAVFAPPELFELLRRRLGTELDTLTSALDGDCGDTCGICDDAIEPGAAVLRDVEMGDVHAECMGEALPGAGPVRPGDKVQCDPDGIVDRDDEPVPGSDGILVAHAYEAAFPAETFASYVTAAQALLGHALA